MPAHLDPRKAFLVRQHGDLVALYTWVNDERALVLVPARRPGAPWYVVMESAAYKYDDPVYLAHQCAKACDVLGIEPSRPNWVRVATIIHEGLPDLVSMPSAPVAEPVGKRYGTLTLLEDGKEIGQEDIRVGGVQGAMYG